jgi:hypothetical protein
MTEEDFVEYLKNVMKKDFRLIEVEKDFYQFNNKLTTANSSILKQILIPYLKNKTTDFKNENHLNFTCLAFLIFLLTKADEEIEQESKKSRQHRKSSRGEQHLVPSAFLESFTKQEINGSYLAKIDTQGSVSSVKVETDFVAEQHFYHIEIEKVLSKVERYYGILKQKINGLFENSFRTELVTLNGIERMHFSFFMASLYLRSPQFQHFIQAEIPLNNIANSNWMVLIMSSYAAYFYRSQWLWIKSTVGNSFSRSPLVFIQEKKDITQTLFSMSYLPMDRKMGLVIIPKDIEYSFTTVTNQIHPEWISLKSKIELHDALLTSSKFEVDGISTLGSKIMQVANIHALFTSDEAFYPGVYYHPDDTPYKDVDIFHPKKFKLEYKDQRYNPLSTWNKYYYVENHNDKKRFTF